jgi:pilus assembly protein CpaF
MSFDLILPFLRPLVPLLEDTEISEIMVTPPGRVFVERGGMMTSLPELVIDERHLQVAVRNIARLLDDDVNDEKPILDARLPDGSRVAALLPPCSLGGTTLTIRRFVARFYSLEELIRVGTITPAVVASLAAALMRRENILISGATTSGKTTLLNALTSLIPPEERLVVIEDTAELHLAHKNVVRFEARRAQRDLPPVTIRDLVKASLRHRPDRIIVGEIRGGEAFDAVQAWNTGHAGSLTTIHANSAQHALSRLTNCVLQAGIDQPYAAIRHNIAETIQWLVHVRRDRGRRIVHECQRVVRYDQQGDQFVVVDALARPDG